MSLFRGKLARAPRIVIVGDAMVDRYVLGEVTRVSPEAPVPVLLAREETMRAGGAANVAANIVALGGSCELICVVGEDEGQSDLRRLLATSGISPRFVVDREHPTTQKTRLVSGTQQIARIDRDGAVGPEALDEVGRLFEAAVRETDIVVLSDYGKGALARIPELLSLAKRVGCRALVDPKTPEPENYRGAFLLKPNMAEFQMLFGRCDESSLVAQARAALSRYDIQHIVVTRGSKGMLLISSDGTTIERPTEALEVFDVSGAGDTVLAALAVALGAGMELDLALPLSNIAAGIAVSHAGTYVVSSADMDRRLAAEMASHSKLVSRPVLLPLLDSQRQRGAKIVFTNGCFDILHPGHVRLLKAAKAEGDVLVVGLNDDASVTRLKGPTRPVNTLADRAEVLAGLDCVDYVVGFETDTPLSLIEAIRPDVLVKGGDYVAQSVVGYDVVSALGGRVVISNFHEGHSTTNTIKKMSAT